MAEYSFSPRKTNRIAEILCIFLCGAALCLFYLAAVKILPFPWAFELLSVMLLTAAVMIMTRVSLKKYIYALSSSHGGESLFTITEQRGGKRETVCSLDVNLISSVTVISPNNSKKQRRKAKKSALSGVRERFNYCIELFPGSEVILTARESRHSDEVVAVIFSPDKTLIEMLSEQIKYNGENSQGAENNENF